MVGLKNAKLWIAAVAIAFCWAVFIFYKLNLKHGMNDAIAYSTIAFMLAFIGIVAVFKLCILGVWCMFYVMRLFRRSNGDA